MPNLIEKYRTANRKLRKLLSPHTAAVCPVCPKCCCTKPTLVSEFDVLIANSCGYDLPSVNQAAEELVNAGMDVLRGEYEEREVGEPCDYLGENGCKFPDDLRPYECTRYICPHLKKVMSPGQMREMRDALHRFGTIHRELLDAIAPKKRG
ncbi:MAG TPA: hypothetical protein VGK34_01385 [Armatimonadota bacterium]|jgi:hypothetical protein